MSKKKKYSCHCCQEFANNKPEKYQCYWTDCGHTLEPGSMMCSFCPREFCFKHIQEHTRDCVRAISIWHPTPVFDAQGTRIS